jgi:hypothetical protein
VGDLYERLLACVTDNRPPRMCVEDAVRAVLELHKPRAVGTGEFECAGCRTSVAFVWWEKCSTIRAVARALEVPIEGDQQ